MEIKPPQFKTSWIDDRVKIWKSLIHERGMFAGKSIKGGETVVVWGGIFLTKEEIREGKHRPQSNVQISDDLYIAEPVGTPERQDDFTNHSCDPNLWMRDEYILEARRDILIGEELTLDYAVFESDPDWKMACSCGSQKCRGLVTGNDWKLKKYKNDIGAIFHPIWRKRSAKFLRNN